MQDRERVLIIGLDGATWTVLGPWMDDGSLPNLARLRRQGCWGELRSTIPPLTAPAWSTFLTGKNPGKHGVFHFVALDDDPDVSVDAKAEIVDGRSIKSPILWDIVAHHGRRIGAINVPMSYPPRPVNGFMITCLLTPPGAAVFTYPPELSQQLPGYQIDLDRFISEKPFARDGDGPRTKRTVKPSLQLMREFHAMEEERGHTALRLMASEPWDVFMVVFTATDRMGHYLWPYHRAEDLDGSAEGRELHDAIYRLYVRLDEMIGELVAQAGPETAVIVMSDHGMGPIYRKNTHWNNWLYRQGYLSLHRGSASTPDGLLLRLGIPRDTIGRLVRRIPGLSRSTVIQKARTAQTAAIDYERSKAYYVRIFDPVGGIRINAQGAERERLRDELLEAIRAATDPQTGGPIVRWAWRREECYHGPYADSMPDIILVMHPDYGSSDRLSNYSAIVTDRPTIGDPGGHHIEGIFIASGPQIAAQPAPLPNLEIADIAPTVLHLMGLPVPDDMDGRVLTEILTAERLRARPVATAPSPGRWPSEADDTGQGELTDEDEELVRDRLRALGYVE
ncbi:MAG TPA: alkaline phosphatase family protein [Roseiflexaceae bacterium]|nr:alkaline phosphatase family protein [Roseiflexaceae bacterium]